MDSFSLSLLVQELRAALGHARLERVQATGSNQFLLKFRSGALVVSVDDRHPALWLLRRTKKSATEHVTPLLLLLRKHLVGCRLGGIEQAEYDRIVRLRLSRQADQDVVDQYSLVIELIDRRANLYLLNADDRIIGRFKTRSPASSELAMEYVLPQQPGKLDPWRVTETELNTLCESTGSLRQALIQHIKGFGPRLAEEVVWRARHSTAYQAFSEVLDQLSNHPQPCLYAPTALALVQPATLQWERELIVAPIQLHWLSEQAGLTVTPFATMLEAVEIYEELVSASRLIQERRRTLATAIFQKRKKVEKRLERMKQERERLGNYEQYRQWGELLLAHVHHATRSERGFVVTDYYAPDQPSVEIPAQPRASIQQTATDYFEIYRKQKRKADSLEQQIGQLEQELLKLSTLDQAVQSATTLEALSSYADELLGPASALPASLGGRPLFKKIPGVAQFLSSEQHHILVGRTAEANQRLTFQIARPHDIWLHAADYPGSHVVLRCKKGVSVPFQSLIEAAQLAAFYSQARGSTAVVVHYTERKHVHKIPGAAPGRVRLVNVKSITVEPRVQATRVDI
ncbi:MAG: NFACT family protein [Acidobacteriota bacterium]|nr:NFACT family protein [Blastocatellia bacterium]MDW8239514.1 NFACT family protein [Acidobacteriota bacterium]